jgi:hypothetical protein
VKILLGFFPLFTPPEQRTIDDMLLVQFIEQIRNVLGLQLHLRPVSDRAGHGQPVLADRPGEIGPSELFRIGSYTWRP